MKKYTVAVVGATGVCQPCWRSWLNGTFLDGCIMAGPFRRDSILWKGELCRSRMWPEPT